MNGSDEPLKTWRGAETLAYNNAANEWQNLGHLEARELSISVDAYRAQHEVAIKAMDDLVTVIEQRVTAELQARHDSVPE